MVQKWAIGAMINMTGSIAINLGTNLMKLSHKVGEGLLCCLSHCTAVRYHIVCCCILRSTHQLLSSTYRIIHNITPVHTTNDTYHMYAVCTTVIWMNTVVVVGADIYRWCCCFVGNPPDVRITVEYRPPDWRFFIALLRISRGSQQHVCTLYVP